MFSTNFFGTKLGQASLASVAAMVAMIALTSQVNMTAKDAAFAQPSQQTSVMLVELA